MIELIVALVQKLTAVYPTKKDLTFKDSMRVLLVEVRSILTFGFYSAHPEPSTTTKFSASRCSFSYGRQGFLNVFPSSSNQNRHKSNVSPHFNDRTVYLVGFVKLLLT